MLLDAPTSNEHEEVDPNLKYDLSGKTPIVLVPQPSNDPNDPLVRRTIYSILDTASY